MIKDKKIIKARVKLLQVGDSIEISQFKDIKVKEITGKYVYFEDFSLDVVIEDGRAKISWFYIDSNKKLRLKKIESNYNNSFHEYVVVKFKKEKNGNSI